VLDYLALRLAIRARLLTLSVCTTGSVNLSATATGYNRAAGSFITDGFAVGMEVNASAFAVPGNNGAHVLTGVTATDLTVDGGLTAEVAGAGRTVAVGLPSTRLWENVAGTPVSGKPYVEEDFVTDNPPTLISMPAAGGVVEHTPLYVLRWYFLADVGVLAAEKYVAAVLALFKAATVFTVGGDAARVRGDVMPSRTRLNEDSTGFVRCTVTIPLRAYSTN
jgi:hypothetical protein